MKCDRCGLEMLKSETSLADGTHFPSMCVRRLQAENAALRHTAMVCKTFTRGFDSPPRLQTVVALGTRYGYGNLIAHLQTAWARHLVKDLDFSEESARLAATGGNGYPFEWQERILANAPTPTFAERIKTLEDLLAFDKNAWQFHEPSYAALCLSEQQISFGKFCEYMRHLCDGQKDAIIQGVTPGAGGAA